MAKKIMDEQVESKYIKGNIVYDYVGAYNDDVYRYNRFNFNKDNTPKANAMSSEPAKIITYTDTVKSLNKMNQAQQQLVEQIVKKAWKAYFDTLRDELYPALDEILKVELDRN